ncbi:MAG: excinuclease ABC subunit A, partial [Blastocatellia bacterium]
MLNLEAIIIRGARVNNLKNITFSLPINQLTVVTGVSGSGKSSLAFDTVYAEGQRRYVESMSAYARQFLERMDKPDIDEAIGICPAIAINQKNSTRNPRSTVATQTEIFDYLRLLYARIGITLCRNCGAVVKRDTPESIADEVMQLPEGTRFFVLFPAAAGTEFSELAAAAAGSAKTKRSRSKTAPAINIKAHLMSLMQRGFTRLYDAAKNDTVELQTPDSFTGKSFDHVFVLVDRLAAKADVRSRLVDSIEACYREGHGQAVIQTVGEEPQQLVFSEKFQCKNCGLNYIQPEPQLFSFNNPFGACPTCQGFGNTIGLDLNLVIPNRELSLADGAIEPFTKPQFEWWRDELKKFAKREAISMATPFAALPTDQQYAVLEGRNGFDGVKGLFDWLETKKYKLHVRVMLSKYRGYTRCPDCKGGRLRQEARDVYVGGKTLPTVVALSIKDARIFFDELELSAEHEAIADRLLKEIRSRLKFLDNVGLDYLSLDRLASTLSGGEAQRIQLATHLGSSLVGALYVLDEPSIGLHPRDSERLIGLLKNLRDIGNTVLVVEHEAEMMRAADH